MHTMNAIAIVIGGRDGVLEQFKTPMARFVGNASLICGIWIMALYTANLAAFMTVQNMEQKISGLDSLKQTVSWPPISNALTREKAKEISKSVFPFS